jgi:nucleoside-diphosphate-sugar epimerase
MSPDSQEIHVIFGATGGAGQAVVRQLAAAGQRVRAVSRQPGAVSPGVEALAADAADAESARRAADGAAVVYNCINAPYTQWPDLLPPLWRNVTAAAGATGARLVVMDNLYMYGPQDGPLTEDTPLAATDKKGRIRIAMAKELMDAHARGRVRAAIGRAADFYGPGVNSALFDLTAFRNALAGQAVRSAGNLDVPHAVSYIDDVARGLVILGEREEALGQVWHLPVAPAISQRQFIEALFAQTGHPTRIQHAPGWMLRLGAVFSPLLRELVGIGYQFERPFQVDSSRFERTFRLTATPVHEGIARTLAWAKDNPENTAN